MREIRYVSVADMLQARDRRAENQREMLEKHAVPLVSFTMNIAGSVKNNDWIERAFREGEKRIRVRLERMNVLIPELRRTIDFTGCETIWAVDADAAELKKRMCAIEEMDALGRLFDIDVIDEKGSHLSRGSERSCLICGGPVRACARSRAHSADELFARSMEIIRGYFQARFTRRIGEMAQRALLREALTTPKPGLVDRENSGSHRDMDLFSFADSACVLRSYFEDCVRIGMEGADFVRLQQAGLDAEEDMLSAVGVNTHKGAIFSLGILCCAWGFCGEDADLDSVLTKAAELGGCALAQMERKNAGLTGGEQQYLRYGLTGARGEAASGFASVQNIALPALEKAISRGKRLNEAGLRALLALMEKVLDSNVIRRAGMAGQKWVMEQAGLLLEGGFDENDLRLLNEVFVEKNISPGGSADLLAIAYFLYEMKNSGM